MLIVIGDPLALTSQTILQADLVIYNSDKNYNIYNASCINSISIVYIIFLSIVHVVFIFFLPAEMRSLIGKLWRWWGDRLLLAYLGKQRRRPTCVLRYHGEYWKVLAWILEREAIIILIISA